MNPAINTQLRTLQLTQFEILKVIDRFCRDHSIHYSLYAGTLLGAVRHQGFIPWDDDLDICMSREDYRRFLSLWEKEKPAVDLLLQTKENSPKFSQSFAKIRKDHTCFLQFKVEIGRYHTGIFVDIFPIDRLPNGFLKRKLFQFRCLKYQLYTREFIPSEGNWMIKAATKVMLALTPPQKRAAKREKLMVKIEKFNHSENLPTIAIETQNSIKTPLPPSFLSDFTEMSFEGESFMCSAAWDEYLTKKYGDYIKLPPEDKRVWTHHPIILDFTRNYEELSEEEKLSSMHYDA